MNLDGTRKLMLLRVTVIFVVLAFIAAAAVSCSMKRGGSPDGADEAADGADGTAEASHYAAVKDSILESVRDKYSERGIEISTIELEAGQGDGAKITLAFPEHTPAQAALAGLKILRDNFPKIRRYVAKVGGKEYACSSRELSYICSQGYSFDCTEEEAEVFIDVVKNGIPEEDADKPIPAEAV